VRPTQAATQTNQESKPMTEKAQQQLETASVPPEGAQQEQRSRTEIIEEVVREIMEQGPSEGEVRTMLNNIAEAEFNRGFFSRS
jgi:uncharacterized protein YpuA (DUF1002 family)